MDIGFVILHYNAIKETKDCVASIQERIDTEDYQIVVVDNCSPNGTGKELKKIYEASERVHVILNTSNAGFAQGNNLGYAYLQEHYKPDFVCILNNDTLLIQDDFLRVIKEEYQESGFGIMGPRIILRDGSDNQVYVKFPERSFIEKEIKRKKSELFQLRTHLDHFVTAYKLTRNQINKWRHYTPESRYKGMFRKDITTERCDTHVLHGCCLVFSRNYMDVFAEGFCPDTFVYKEEELLYLRCRKKRLPMIYNPELLIKHLEDVSTDTMVKNGRKKIMFQLENEIKSYGIVLREMDKE